MGAIVLAVVLVMQATSAAAEESAERNRRGGLHVDLHTDSFAAYSESVTTFAQSAQQQVRALFDEAFDAYIRYAFPKDELLADTCAGVDTQGGYALTLIDALDMLALVGRHAEFRHHARWVVENVVAARDVNVSVFETNIRVIGGLLAAHFMYEEGVVVVDPAVDDYNGGLLALAVAFADRLLPAFRSPTGIPYGSVNLLSGVWENEIDITATASATTFSLEFTILSAVTGNAKYERASRKALRAIYRHRSDLGMVGNHINITDGEWTIPHFGTGTGSDSFFEYLLKSYVLTGDLEYWSMFEKLDTTLDTYSRKGPWYLNAEIQSGQVMHRWHNSLSGFYPGALASIHDVEKARESLDAAHFVFSRFGAIPEGYGVSTNGVVPGQLGYPLRPEHVESMYMMHRTTREVSWLFRGYEVLLALKKRTRTRCGFVSLQQVFLPPGPQTYGRRMESFFLAETLKYLYLLFDVEDRSPMHDPARQWVFNTEGHPLPVKEEWNRDSYYDRRLHRCSAGLPPNHPLANRKKGDPRCPRGKPTGLFG